jgi:3-amino-5-hydroxybenzoate synthase
MNEFEAAILIAQLERLDELTGMREKNAALLDSFLKDIRGIVPQTRDANATRNPHYMYMFYYDSASFIGMDRMTFVDNLIAEGIPSFIAYPVVVDVEFFKSGDFRLPQSVEAQAYRIPNARKIANEVVWLPHFALLGDEKDMEEIAEAILKIQLAATEGIRSGLPVSGSAATSGPA